MYWKTIQLRAASYTTHCNFGNSYYRRLILWTFQWGIDTTVVVADVRLWVYAITVATLFYRITVKVWNQISNYHIYFGWKVNNVIISHCMLRLMKPRCEPLNTSAPCSAITRWCIAGPSAAPTVTTKLHTSFSFLPRCSGYQYFCITF